MKDQNCLRISLLIFYNLGKMYFEKIVLIKATQPENVEKILKRNFYYN